MLKGKKVLLAITTFLILLMLPTFAIASNGEENNNKVEINGKVLDKTELPVIQKGESVKFKENETKYFVLKDDEKEDEKESKLIIGLESKGTSVKPDKITDNEVNISSGYNWKKANVLVEVKSWLGINAGSCELIHNFAYDGDTIPTWQDPYIDPEDAYPNYWSDEHASAAYKNSEHTKARAEGFAKYHNSLGDIDISTWNLEMWIDENSDGTYVGGFDTE